MSKFKASTRLTEINAEQIEQLRREYNQLSVSKFSLSKAFKQYALQRRSYVVIAKNGNFEDFSKYNQILANLYTNLSQIKSDNSETNKRINNTLRNLIKMKLDVSRLCFKTLEIKTTVKPNIGPTIHLPLFDDSHSDRKKQYTISFTEAEHAEYKEKYPEGDFLKLLFCFFNEFSVYEEVFSNTSIDLTKHEKFLQCSDLVNKHTLNKSKDDKAITSYLVFLDNWSESHGKLISGSKDLINFIGGAK